jgi:hypothetical protein
VFCIFNIMIMTIFIIINIIISIVATINISNIVITVIITIIINITVLLMSGVVDECRVLDKEVFKRWKATLTAPHPPSAAVTSTSTAIATSLATATVCSSLVDLEFLSELLKEKTDYLLPYNYYRLLSLCADKVVLIYLHLLRDGRACGKVVHTDGIEITQLNADFAAIQNCFKDACRRKHLENYSDAVLTHLRPLRHAISLLSLSRNCDGFQKTLETLFKVDMLCSHMLWSPVLLCPIVFCMAAFSSVRCSSVLFCSCLLVCCVFI